MNVPYVTTATAALACVESMKHAKESDGITIKALHDFLK